MFFACGNIASNPTKIFRTLLGAEAPGYLLLNFGHSEIIFTLVVGERHYGVVHESQNFRFIVHQSFKKTS